MRVVCIGKEYFGWHPDSIAAVNHIQIGDVVDVIDEGEECGGWYEFSQYPDLCWYKRNFAPLSEIDETEMERNYKTEKV